MCVREREREQDKLWMDFVCRQERPEWKGNCNKLSNNNKLYTLL